MVHSFVRAPRPLAPDEHGTTPAPIFPVAHDKRSSPRRLSTSHGVPGLAHGTARRGARPRGMGPLPQRRGRTRGVWASQSPQRRAKTRKRTKVPDRPRSSPRTRARARGAPLRTRPNRVRTRYITAHQPTQAGPRTVSFLLSSAFQSRPGVAQRGRVAAAIHRFTNSLGEQQPRFPSPSSCPAHAIGPCGHVARVPRSSPCGRARPASSLPEREGRGDTAARGAGRSVDAPPRTSSRPCPPLGLGPPASGSGARPAPAAAE